MVIGLCYDLRDDYLKMGYTEEQTAEFDRISTIEAIDKELLDMGFKTVRIGHIRSLVEKLASGNRWDMVFNICEGLFGTGREAQVPALLDAYEIPYVFSGPLVMAMTLDKALTKLVVSRHGINTPEHVVVYSTDDLKKIDIPFPLFVKPLSEGTGKGINSKSLVYDKTELFEICDLLLKKYKQAVLVEKYLEGREFTAGITGSGEKAKCIGVMEILFNNKAEKQIYSYINKEEYEERVEYALAAPEDEKKCAELALNVWKAVRAEDGGRIDIRYDENGIANFLEINPLAGLHPEHSDLPILARLNGINYSRLMKMIMESALKKLKKS